MFNFECSNCIHKQVCFIKSRIKEMEEQFITICEENAYNDIHKHLNVSVSCNLFNRI